MQKLLAIEGAAFTADFLIYLVRMQVQYWELNDDTLRLILICGKEMPVVNIGIVYELSTLLKYAGVNALRILTLTAFRGDALDIASRNLSSIPGLPREKDDRDTAVQLAQRLPCPEKSISGRLREYRKITKRQYIEVSNENSPTPNHWNVQVFDTGNVPSSLRLAWLAARIGPLDDHAIPMIGTHTLILTSSAVSDEPLGTFVWDVSDTNRFKVTESVVRGYSRWIYDTLINYGGTPADLGAALRQPILAKR